MLILIEHNVEVLNVDSDIEAIEHNVEVLNVDSGIEAIFVIVVYDFHLLVPLGVARTKWEKLNHHPS